MQKTRLRLGRWDPDWRRMVEAWAVKKKSVHTLILQSEDHRLPDSPTNWDDQSRCNWVWVRPDRKMQCHAMPWKNICSRWEAAHPSSTCFGARFCGRLCTRVVVLPIPPYLPRAPGLAIASTSRSPPSLRMLQSSICFFSHLHMFLLV